MVDDKFPLLKLWHYLDINNINKYNELKKEANANTNTFR
jgi:hypothetical protein